MSAAQMVLGLLKLLGPALSALEVDGIAELNSLIAGIQNDVEKQALQDLVIAVDSFAKSQIAKI